MTTQRPGAITLVTVFLVGAIALIMLMADNVRTIQLRTRVHAQTVSEQAFYAAQSCLEEGFYQLRTDAHYAGSSTITVGSSTCVVGVSPDPVHPTNGQLHSTGVAGSSSRVIAAGYADAGASVTRQHTQIMHIIDRSGSMQEDSCSNTAYRTDTDCMNHHFVWGPMLQPISDTRNAAIQFNDGFIDPAYDQVGLVSFSTDPSLDQPLTNDITAIDHQISILTAGGTTDIGAAIDLATAQLTPTPSVAQFEILLTDGVPNSGCGVDCTIAKAATAKSKGITMITIGLGTATNPTLLQSVASTNPTTDQLLYFPAHSHSDLAAIYAQISSIIQTYNIHQGSWNEQ